MRASFHMVLGCVSWPRPNHVCQIDSCMLDCRLSVTNARHKMVTLILPTAVYLKKALEIYSKEALGGGQNILFLPSCCYKVLKNLKKYVLSIPSLSVIRL